MKYYKAFCTLPLDRYINCSEKAYCFTVANGYTKSNNERLWIPKSIVKVSDPNEVGNVYLYLPMWFVAKNDIYRKVESIVEVDFDEVVDI